MCPHKMAGQLESCIWSENLYPWPISIVCFGDCYWLLVCSDVLVCPGIQLISPKLENQVGNTSLFIFCTKAKLKKCLFGIAYPGFHLVGRSVGIFFLNIYYLHMDGNGKNKQFRFGKKNIFR